MTAACAARSEKAGECGMSLGDGARCAGPARPLLVEVAAAFGCSAASPPAAPASASSLAFPRARWLVCLAALPAGGLRADGSAEACGASFDRVRFLLGRAAAPASLASTSAAAFGFRAAAASPP